MKLYATVTSERASKGQGGNEYLDIEVLTGSAKKPERILFLRVLPPDGEDKLHAVSVLDGTYEVVRQVQDTAQDCALALLLEKGEKQKGESFIDTLEKHKQNAFENGIY